MIRLISPGGAGKSTIGALLAERLNVLKHLLGEYPALLSMSRITTPAVHTCRRAESTNMRTSGARNATSVSSTWRSPGPS